jgi:hypothetical protein
MPLNADVVEGVVATNFKTLAEQSAVQTNHTSAQFAQSAALATQNAVADQQEMRAISRMAAGALIKRISELDPTEAESINTVRSGNELAEMQIASKLAQSARPETGAG